MRPSGLVDDIHLQHLHTIRSFRKLTGDGVRQRVSQVVDTERFSPKPKPDAALRQLQINPDEAIISHFSNLKPIKRAPDIVESAPIVLEHYPTVVYVIVGEGIDRAGMQARAAELGVADRFRFPGWIDYDLVPDYMNASDIIVMASRGEGMSRVYLTMNMVMWLA